MTASLLLGLGLREADRARQVAEQPQSAMSDSLRAVRIGKSLLETDMSAFDVSSETQSRRRLT